MAAPCAMGQNNHRTIVVVAGSSKLPIDTLTIVLG
jgi:hypothetical protein